MGFKADIIIVPWESPWQIHKHRLSENLFQTKFSMTTYISNNPAVKNIAKNFNLFSTTRSAPVKKDWATKYIYTNGQIINIKFNKPEQTTAEANEKNSCIQWTQIRASRSTPTLNFVDFELRRRLEQFA